MTGIIRLAGVAIIGVFFAIILKEKHRALGISVTLGAFFLIVTIVVGGEIRSALESVKTYADADGLSSYSTVLVKALGIAYITSATQSVCSDAGENALGTAVELAGKGEIILLCVPLIKSLMDIAEELLKI